MDMRNLIELAGNLMEIAGVALIVGGTLLAAGRWAALRDTAAPYHRLRQDLGRAILLGLEILVAADIIRTVAFKPTMSSIAILAVVVGIRTFLSWSLTVEIEGRWPWQQRQPGAATDAG
jgi:uncharacterized membrane protein